MPKAKILASARIRAEVIRLVALILAGKFATYGSIAIHLIVVVRQVAAGSSRWTVEDSASLPATVKVPTHILMRLAFVLRFAGLTELS